jgi:hypothetical protein
MCIVMKQAEIGEKLYRTLLVAQYRRGYMRDIILMQAEIDGIL